VTLVNNVIHEMGAARASPVRLARVPGAIPSPTVEGRLRVTRSCSVALDELQWRFGPSGGPGGQHANTSNTRAEVRFDIAGSPSLGPRQRARLIERLGPTVRVVVGDARSQARNRELALERLRSRLAEALRVQRRRVPTKPSAAARRSRIEAKRRRGELKRRRRAHPDLDE